jgi:hypothetical protein
MMMIMMMMMMMMNVNKKSLHGGNASVVKGMKLKKLQRIIITT